MWDAKVWKQEEPLIERLGKGGIASTLPCHHCTNAVASLLVSFSESLYHQIRNMVALSDTLCVPEPSLLIRFCFQLHCMSVSVLKHVASVSIQVCEHVVPSCFACQCPALSLSSINITAGIAETGRAKIREQDRRRRRRKKKKYCTNNCVDFGYFWVMAFKHWTLGDCQFVVVQAYRIGDHQNQKSATLQILKAYQLQPCVPGAGGYLFEELVGVHVKPQWGPWIASLFLVGLCSVAEMLVLLYDLCREWNIISLSRCFKVAASNRTIRTGLPSRLPGRDRTKHNVKWCQHSTSCNKVSKHC